MATLDKAGTATLQELIVSSLATADVLTKLLIEKGLITEAEFMEKLSAERVGVIRLDCAVSVPNE